MFKLYHKLTHTITFIASPRLPSSKMSPVCSSISRPLPPPLPADGDNASFAFSRFRTSPLTLYLPVDARLCAFDHPDSVSKKGTGNGEGSRVRVEAWKATSEQLNRLCGREDPGAAAAAVRRGWGWRKGLMCISDPSSLFTRNKTHFLLSARQDTGRAYVPCAREPFPFRVPTQLDTPKIGAGNATNV